MASTLTKAQLCEQLEALRVENQRLATLNESLTNDISAYVERLNNAKRVYREMSAQLEAAKPRSGAWRQRTVPAREETESHREYAAMLAKARKAAMNSGKTVLVG